MVTMQIQFKISKFTVPNTKDLNFLKSNLREPIYISKLLKMSFKCHYKERVLQIKSSYTSNLEKKKTTDTKTHI